MKKAMKYALFVCCSPYASGVGKTHYIGRKIKSKRGQLTIVINESFSRRIVIQQLRRLPMESHIVLYFNFTLLQPSVSDYRLHPTDI